MTERGSTRHSPRLDDALEDEVQSLVRGAPVEARAEEWRWAEAPAEGEPTPNAFPAVDNVGLRSQLAISLRPGAFPADRDRLIEVAREQHADDTMVNWLSALPAGREFENVERVWEALGGARETRDPASMDGPLAVPVPTAAPTRPTPDPVHPDPTPPDPAHSDPAHSDPAHSDPAHSDPAHSDPAVLARAGALVVATAELVVGAAIEVVRIIARKR
jgi:hypothetical protein